MERSFLGFAADRAVSNSVTRKDKSGPAPFNIVYQSFALESLLGLPVDAWKVGPAGASGESNVQVSGTNSCRPALAARRALRASLLPNGSDVRSNALGMQARDESSYDTPPLGFSSEVWDSDSVTKSKALRTRLCRVIGGTATAKALDGVAGFLGRASLKSATDPLG